jgi:hypothetical protein
MIPPSWSMATRTARPQRISAARDRKVIVVCRTFCRSAVNAKRTRDRITAARSRGRSPRRRGTARARARRAGVHPLQRLVRRLQRELPLGRSIPWCISWPPCRSTKTETTCAGYEFDSNAKNQSTTFPESSNWVRAKSEGFRCARCAYSAIAESAMARACCASITLRQEVPTTASGRAAPIAHNIRNCRPTVCPPNQHSPQSDKP